MSLQYLGDVAIDPEVYSNWPEVASDCWISYHAGSGEAPPHFAVVRDEKNLSRSLVENELPVSDNVIAKLVYGDSATDDRSFIQSVWVMDEFRRRGLATFLGTFVRTWLAENKNRRLVAAFGSATPVAQLVVDSVAESYDVPIEEIVSE